MLLSAYLHRRQFIFQSIAVDISNSAAVFFFYLLTQLIITPFHSILAFDFIEIYELINLIGYAEIQAV